jgi:hypothetical protein
MQYSKTKRMENRRQNAIKNFTKDRHFRNTVGNTFSTKMNIDNVIVISLTIFLSQPTKMIGYTDDWIIYTSHKQPRVAEARLEKTADEVIKLTNENVFRILTEKTKSMFIHRKNRVLERRPRI